jgi:hypothetical protein
VIDEVIADSPDRHRAIARPQIAWDGEFANSPTSRASLRSTSGAQFGKGAPEIAEYIAAHALDSELGLDFLAQRIGERAGAGQLDIAERICSTVSVRLTESGVPSVSRTPSDRAISQRPSLSWTGLTLNMNLASSKMCTGR